MIKFKFFGNDEFYECTNIADLISAVRKNSFFTKKYKIVGFYIQKNIFKYESVLCVLYEKSKEIYSKCHAPFFREGKLHTINELMVIQSCAKDYALIMINEILEATKTEIDRPEFTGTVYNTYWQEVKQELLKL